MTSWALGQMPDQSGRTVVVTGATGGLGHHVCLEFARRGALVVLAARSVDKLQATTAALRAEVPAAELRPLVVDLSDLDDIRRAAGVAADLGAVDVLVNNAGVMAPPAARTREGLDVQIATNHYGPFLLTGLLLPQLSEADGRVVTVSSNAHRAARRAPLDDPRLPRARRLGGVERWRGYAESKLANLLFTLQLQRRLDDAGSGVSALAAHPGYTATHLLATGQTGRSSGGLASILNGAMRATAQPAAAGALPLLMAATADLPGGSYCGPTGPGGWRGAPGLCAPSALASDPAAAARLWELSEATTGLRWP